MKIWIGGKLGVRDWIDVVLAVNSLSVVDTTLPLSAEHNLRQFHKAAPPELYLPDKMTAVISLYHFHTWYRVSYRFGHCSHHGRKPDTCFPRIETVEQ